MTRVEHSSQSDEWYSPGHIVERARLVMGGIDLDPASSAAANATIQAARFYTSDQDGLLQPWAGRVWLNPPYSTVASWTAQLMRAYIDGAIDQAVLLVPARTDTRWFDPLYVYPHCFIRGRLRFGGAKSGAPFPSAVVYLGPHVARFVDVFGALGRIDACLNPPTQTVQLSLLKEAA